MRVIATSASFTAYKLISDASLVHYNAKSAYHRKELRNTIKELRKNLDDVEAFLDRTEPETEVAA